MFKALKWSYERGVEHENLRIKKLLGEFRDETTYMFAQQRNGTAKIAIDELDIRSKAMQMIQSITEPQRGYEFTEPPKIDIPS